MQEPILKAVAMPPRVFWAPMVPSVANIVVQGVLVIMWVGTGYKSSHNPIFFLFTFVLVHLIIILYGVREPHLSNMMKSYGPFMSPTRNIYRVRGKKLAP